MTGSTRWLIAVVAGVGVLTAVAIVLGMTADEADLDPGTPEATVQAYLQAVTDRDAEAAVALFSDELTDRCGINIVRDSFQYGPRNFRATLGDVETREATTDVFVEITERYGDDPLFGGESTFSEMYSLEQQDGEWRIVHATWPVWCPTEPVR